MKKRWERK